MGATGETNVSLQIPTNISLWDTLSRSGQICPVKDIALILYI